MPHFTDDEHQGCRVSEFARWDRIVLEHEREHLSKCMTGAAFMRPAESEAILHEISDIDYLLAQLPKRVKTP